MITAINMIQVYHMVYEIGESRVSYKLEEMMNDGTNNCINRIPHYFTIGLILNGSFRPCIRIDTSVFSTIEDMMAFIKDMMIKHKITK